MNNSAKTDRADALAHMVVRMGPWLILLLVLFVLYEIVTSVSGRHGFFEVWLFLMQYMKLIRGFAYVFGAVGIFYGLRERELRRAAVERLTRRVQEMETAGRHG